MNVLVIDDQKEVVLGIVEVINWDNLGVTQVFSAYSAADAREILSKYSIDIMLCDIEMPKENGLELLAWVRSQNLNTECLFLTSHAEFNYAKEALRLGSFDYILQPAPYGEIVEALTKLINQITQNRKLDKLKKVQKYEDEVTNRMADDYFREALETGSRELDVLDHIFELHLMQKYVGESVGIVLQQVLTYGEDKESQNLHHLTKTIYEIQNRILKKQNLQTILLRYRPLQYILIVFGESLNTDRYCACFQEYHSYERKYLDFQSAQYLGNVIEPASFLDEVQRLLHFAENNVMRKAEIFLYSDVIVDDATMNLDKLRIERWEYYLEHNRGNQIITSIRQYFEFSPQQNRNALKVLQNLFWKFNSAVVSVAHKKNMEYNSFFCESTFPFEKYIEAYKTYDQFLQAVTFVVDTLDKVGFNLNDVTEEDIVQKVKNYIDDNLSQNLSRKMIADYVHLNEDYLTRVFKKKTGYMLKEFIIKEKMALAKDLLVKTNISISIIAIKSGFTNFSHFSQVFRKLEGMTPNEYRNLFR
ncbi:MAG TPA: response regulator [Clostridiales bacterium]|nr:response regulator [Clostridiales bacterium]